MVNSAGRTAQGAHESELTVHTADVETAHDKRFGEAGEKASAKIRAEWQGEPHPMASLDPGNLIWIDLEMTGLDPDNDRIIEIATVVTDSDLNVIAEGPELAIRQPRDVMDAMEAMDAMDAMGAMDAMESS